jgi:hypothetical protein
MMMFKYNLLLIKKLYKKKQKILKLVNNYCLKILLIKIDFLFLTIYIYFGI